MIKKVSLGIASLLLFAQANAQDWVEKMQDPSVNFYEVQAAFNDYYKDKEKGGPGYKQFKRWEYRMEPRVFPTGERIPASIAAREVDKYNKSISNIPHRKSNAQWRPLGKDDWTSRSYNPGNGRVNTVRVDPTDTNTIYIGTPGGGAWKTTDGGLTWAPISDFLTVIGVTDIVINPLNPNTVYLATGDGFGNDTYGLGVMVSHDGGQTWNNTGFSTIRLQDIVCRRMVMNPQDTNTLLVATDIGLLKTNDAGATWSNVLSGDVRNVKYRPFDTSTVYASTDQFYRSTNGGSNFSRVSTGISPGSLINRMEIAVSPADSNVVYAVAGAQSDASFQGLYRSTNAGVSFTRMSTTPNILSGSQTGNASGGQSWYDLAIAVNDNDANEIYVGGINVWRSTNGGTSWNISSHWVYPNNVGYTHADIHSLEWYNGKIYCGSDGGVFYSSNNGNSWNNISAGLGIAQYYKMAQTEQDSNVLMAGAQDNGCNYRDLSGNWYHVLGGDGMTVEIDPFNFNTIYYSWQGGGIQRSYNAGISRTNISGTMRNLENGAWVTPFLIDPNSSTTLLAGYENVWKTTNRGTSWSRISNFSGSATIRQLKVAPSNSNYIYSCTNDHRLRRTTNGGTTWSLVNSGLPVNRVISDIEIHPLHEDSVWVSFSGYFTSTKVFVTGDGGQTWTNLSTNMPNLPVNDLAWDTLTEIMYAGTDVGVYYQDRKVNAGWWPYNNGLPNVEVSELEIHSGARKLRASTYGRGIWDIDLIGPNLPTSIESQTTAQKTGIAIGPNPTNDLVEVTLNGATLEVMRLYDVKGQLLQEFPQPKANFKIDLSAYENGLYLLEGLEGERSQLFKLVKN